MDKSHTKFEMASPSSLYKIPMPEILADSNFMHEMKV